MAVTNTEDEVKVVDDDKEVTDEDLKKLKDDQEVEAEKPDETESTDDDFKEEPEETEKDEDSEEEAKTESDEETSEFVKEFPNIKGDTPEEYAKNLEVAYQNSFAELKRIRDENAKPEDTDIEEDATPIDPRLLYLDQMLQKDITDSFNTFSKSYPQTKDPIEYDKFQTEASNLSQYIISTQKRVAPASELYSKVAAILGWKPEDVVEDKDKLNAALKDKASNSKTTSATKPKAGPSKVTDAQITVAKQMGGWTEGKSDAEIRKELETVT